MDLDSVLGLPRWKILELIAREPSSPIEIAEKIGTSVSYISQQLKLLEFGGYVRKEKTGASEKGKPRSVYSINKEILHLSSVFSGGSVKKEIILEDYHKAILRIWSLENSFFHYYLEKIYWKLEEEIDSIEAILCKESGNKIEVLIISDSSKVKLLVNSLAKKFNAVAKINVVSKNSERNYQDFITIHDPHFMLGVKKEVKGGR